MTQDFQSPLNIEDHSLLLVKGPDAIKFLQGQVTCDIAQLAISENNSQSSLGAHCTPKGRMLFSFRACAVSEDTIALAIYSPLIEQALTALKKYSIFSKVELVDASQDYTIVGLAEADLGSIASLFDETPNSSGQVCHQEDSAIIAIGDGFYECWLPTDTAQTLDFPPNKHSGSDYWTAANIQLGIGEVRAETVEEFLPQMLNYQAVGQGISFTKGCYTGQEVVARMQYLGKLKRHMHHFSVEQGELLVPGTPLYTPGNKQAIGHVVLASSLDQPQQLLAVTTVEAVENDRVYIDLEYQQKLQALPLPYAINKDES